MRQSRAGPALSRVPSAGLGDTWDMWGPPCGTAGGLSSQSSAAGQLQGKEQKKEFLLAFLLEVA